MDNLRLNLPPLNINRVEPGTGSGAAKPEKSGGVDFSSLVKSTIDEVNNTQKNAADLAQKFEVGDPSVDLVRVMVEMQKSRVSFEAVSQVRNKLVEAYREVMNMQV